jgi:hypothetical protein
MVVVCQCPCGAWQISRSPLGARPRSRVMLVLAADSSMKTSRAGSSPPWRRFHRRRACATSGRFCSAAWSVFFIGQSHLGQDPVDDRGPLASAPSSAFRVHAVTYLPDQPLKPHWFASTPISARGCPHNKPRSQSYRGAAHPPRVPAHRTLDQAPVRDNQPLAAQIPPPRHQPCPSPHPTRSIP